MRKILALFLAVLMLTACAISAQAAPVYDLETAKQSVVRVRVTATVADSRFPQLTGSVLTGLGSGFFVGDINDENVQYIVTAAHVLNYLLDSGDMSKPTYPFRTENGGVVYIELMNVRIEVLFSDENDTALANVEKVSGDTDLAVLRLNAATNRRKPAVLLDKKNFTSKDTLFSMGFPAAAEVNMDVVTQMQLLSDTSNVVVQSGTFSSWTPNASTNAGDQINTSATNSPGISGGPLVDENGYVVGVCVSHSTADTNASYNYAVATDELLKLLGSITEVKYTVGPLSQGLSTTMIIIIAVAVVAIAVLVGLILANNNKKNSRSLEMKGSMSGKVVPLKKGTPVVIGRDPKRCQIVYPKDAAGVSSVHCTITYDGTQVTVADNGSSYGTFVGGVKVEPGKPVVMHRGQEVTFGSDKNSAALH